MSQVRRLCANCMCYHCQNFVMPPEPFCNFTLPFKDKAEQHSNSLSYSQSQAIQSLSKKHKEQLSAIVNRLNPSTPVKNTHINLNQSDDKRQTQTISTERHQRINHHALSASRNYQRASTPISRRVHQSARPSSLHVQRQNIIYTIPPPPSPQIINTFIRPFSVLASPTHMSTPTIRYIPPSAINKVDIPQSIINKVGNLNSNDSNIVQNSGNAAPSVPTIPNQFLQTKFNQMPNFSSMVGKSKGLTSQPALVPQNISINRRKRVQKCIVDDYRCLGVNLKCDRQNQLIIDDTGHVKKNLSK